MAKATKSKKMPIGQYDHKGKKRVNNPPVGLVTPDRKKGITPIFQVGLIVRRLNVFVDERD